MIPGLCRALGILVLLGGFVGPRLPARSGPRRVSPRHDRPEFRRHTGIRMELQQPVSLLLARRVEGTGRRGGRHWTAGGYPGHEHNRLGEPTDTSAGRSILLGHCHPAHRRQFTHVGRAGRGERWQRVWRLVLSTADPGVALRPVSTAVSPSGFSRPPDVSRQTAPTTSARTPWTWVASTGQTLYLNESRATAVSAFLMYEFHGAQEGTGVHPWPEPRSRLFGNATVSAWKRPAAAGGGDRVCSLADNRHDRAVPGTRGL